LAPGGGLLMPLMAAELGAAVVFFGWRTAR